MYSFEQNGELNTIYYVVAHCTLCFVFGVLYFPMPPPIYQIGIKAWLDRNTAQEVLRRKDCIGSVEQKEDKLAKKLWCEFLLHLRNYNSRRIL